MRADCGLRRGRDERAAAHAQREKAIAGVVRLDHAVEGDRRVARDRERQRRVALQFLERSGADHPALVDEHDLVGEALDLGDRVGDVDDRQREAIAQPLEERQDLVLGRPVERRQRLVHQEELGLRQERPSDRHPLALAAGKLARSAVEQRRDAEELDHFVEADAPAPGLALCARRAEQEVAADREMGEQARLLEHIAERTFVGRQERAVPILPDVAADDADSVADPREPGDAAQ